MENMLKLLENMCAATKKEQLMPVLDVSCTMTAKLILWIFELCAPAFGTSLGDLFVPLKDAVYTPEFDESRYRLPDGINVNTLFMKKSAFIAFTGITGAMSADTEGKITHIEWLLSQAGKLFKEESWEAGQPVIVSAVTIDEIAEGICFDDNNKPINSWYIVFVSKIMICILKYCADSHPELCKNIRMITDKVNFAACMAKQKSD